ncbi:hypothetical protein [Psittacicella hinzii]|uniref:Uncharacterized protein n=1 Tax=Psittacicella hinzii TaxID=2028575 RepID=A0A3A1YJ96_9GAMM|nr:hypothetical protein [Psittacicella hinzii]RIY37506.1 hypothetical protein CKF58_04870 [Psittacicella hinzii]
MENLIGENADLTNLFLLAEIGTPVTLDLSHAVNVRSFKNAFLGSKIDAVSIKLSPERIEKLAVRPIERGDKVSILGMFAYSRINRVEKFANLSAYNVGYESTNEKDYAPFQNAYIGEIDNLTDNPHARVTID